MSYYESGARGRISFARLNNTLITLIAINLIIFVALAFINAVYHLRFSDPNLSARAFSENWVSWLSLPADGSRILSRPWTVLTHMFTHTSIWHILGNMIWLWFFGYILQDLTGSRKIVPVYLYSGLGGALAFVLSFNFLPGLRDHLPYATAIGASAGVMGIAAAVTTISPGYRVLPIINGGIPIWIITAIYLLLDLALIPSGNEGGHLAHLAGALVGFLFVYSFRRGYDWGGWINAFFDWINELFNPDKPKKGTDPKTQLYYKSGPKPFKKTPNITEQRVDEILDKISTRGYNSLSPEEIELLKRASGKTD